MPTFLIDTDILIDFSKKRAPMYTWILNTLEKKHTTGICAIEIVEFYYGLQPGQITTWKEFLNSLHFFELTKEIAFQAGTWRYQYARLGKQLSVSDSIIAAIAKEYNLTVVTNNIKDYPVPGIKILSLQTKN